MTKSVLSIEQMQTLIDRGVDVSVASWLRVRDKLTGNVFLAENKSFEVLYGRVVLSEHFDLSDILELLPTFIRRNDRLYDLHSDCKHSIGYSIDWEDAADEYVNGDELYLVDKSGDNMIDSAYQMLLWCIENNPIKPSKP